MLDFFKPFPFSTIIYKRKTILQNDDFLALHFLLGAENPKLNCCTFYFDPTVPQLTSARRADWACPAQLARLSSEGPEYQGLAQHVAFSLK